MSSFEGVFRTDLIDDNDAGVFKLVLPFSYNSDVAGIKITAPIGFETDFCSVPRVPLAYTLLGDKYRKAGTIHDWLYKSHILNRGLSDEVLREMIILEGCCHIDAMAFYLAVKQFGSSHW